MVLGTNMEIVPLKDYVLLEEIHKENTSGIILPDNPDIERSNKCRIISGGNFQKGDIVLIKPHLFDEIVEDGKKFLIGKEENIIATLK